MYSLSATLLKYFEKSIFSIEFALKFIFELSILKASNIFFWSIENSFEKSKFCLIFSPKGVFVKIFVSGFSFWALTTSLSFEIFLKLVSKSSVYQIPVVKIRELSSLLGVAIPTIFKFFALFFKRFSTNSLSVEFSIYTLFWESYEYSCELLKTLSSLPTISSYFQDLFSTSISPFSLFTSAFTIFESSSLSLSPKE